MSFVDERVKQIFSSLSAKDRTAVEALLSKATFENSPNDEIDTRANTYIQGALKLSRPAQKAALELGFISGDLNDIPYEAMLMASKGTPFERDATKLFLEYGSDNFLSYRYDNDNSQIIYGSDHKYSQIIKPLLTEENIQAAAIKNPFSYSYYNGDKKFPALDWSKYSTQDLILATERSSPDAIIDSYPFFRDRPDAQQILDATIKNNPMYGFDKPSLQTSNPDLYKGFMIRAVKEDPSLFYTNLDYYKDPALLPDAQKIISALSQTQRDEIIKGLDENPKRELLSSLENNYKNNVLTQAESRSIISHTINDPKVSYAARYFDSLYKYNEFKDIFQDPENQKHLLNHALRDSSLSIARIDTMRDLPFYDDFVKEIVAKRPWSAINSLDSLKDRSDFPEIIDKLALSRPAAMYALGVVSENFTPDQRKRMVDQSTDGLADALEKDPDYSSDVAKLLNGLHETPDAVRYGIVKNLDAQAFTRLIANNADLDDGGMFTSSFNYVYNQMKLKAAQEGTNALDIIEKNNFDGTEKVRFFDTIGAFGKAKDLISTISPDQKLSLVQYIMDDMADDIERAPEALRLIEGFPKNDPSLAALEGRIISGFLEAKENGFDRDRDAYGLVARAYVEKLGFTPNADNKKFFDQIMQEKRYQLLDVDKTPVDGLFDSSKRNFQVQVFYNDVDGQYNYDVYNKMMKSQGWKSETVDDKFTHYQKTQNGRTVHIYANVPDKDLGEEDIKESTDAIFDDIKEKQKGAPSVIIHRGHSYFVENTIELIPPEAKVVFLGACGGSNYFDDVLERAPKAAIITTQGVGVRDVNDPIIAGINQSIFNEKSIDWHKMQQMVDRIPNENALDYRMPPKSYNGYFLRNLDDLDHNPDSPKLSGTYLGNQFASAVQGAAVLPAPSENSPTVTRNQNLALASPT